MEKDFFSADENESVIEVSARAMQRSEETVYSPVVVESYGKYKGLVSVRKLLDTIVNVEVAENTRDLMFKNKILTQQRQILGNSVKNFRGSFIGIEGLPDDLTIIVLHYK